MLRDVTDWFVIETPVSGCAKKTNPRNMRNRQQFAKDPSARRCFHLQIHQDESVDQPVLGCVYKNNSMAASFTTARDHSMFFKFFIRSVLIQFVQSLNLLREAAIRLLCVQPAIGRRKLEVLLDFVAVLV